MTKNILLALALFILGRLALAEVTVASIDMQKVIVTIKQGKKISQKLKKEYDKKAKVMKKAEEKLLKDQQAFAKQQLVMNKSAKDKKRNELQQNRIKLQEQAMLFQKQMRELENKEKRPILEKLKTIVDAVSKKSGADVVFERNSAGVLYAKKQVDLTTDVIKAYDKKHPAK